MVRKRSLLRLTWFVVGALAHMPQAALAATAGDAWVVYGELSATNPRVRTWTYATQTLGGESSGAAAAASVRHSVVQAAPSRNEMLAGYQTTGGVLYIQRWNGSTWSAEWNVTVGNGNLQRFDIAYEQSSGNALVVYGANAGTTNELRYRTWNGSSWVGPSNLDTIRTSGTVHGVLMAAEAGSDNIGLAWADSNLDLSANYWNGASDTWVGEPDAALSTGLSVVGTATAVTNKSFGIATETLTGDLLVVWGSGTTTDLQYVTRAQGAGSSWGTPSVETNLPEEPTMHALCSDPASDNIMYANATDNGADADAAVWSGSAWVDINNFDTTIDTVAAGTEDVDCDWVVEGGVSHAVVTYDDNNAAGVDWLSYSEGVWTVQSDYSAAPAPVGTNDFQHEIIRDIYHGNQLLVLIVDANSDSFVKHLSKTPGGFTWSSIEPGATSIETSGSVANGRHMAASFHRYVGGTRTFSFVDADGNDVVSPSVAMGSSDYAFSCQTTTGTLGTSTQKLRVSNTTGNRLWTLSIAATLGETSLWTSQYDYNDSSGTPAGCADGADADTKGGQLTINPSGMTNTPQSLCLTDGITLGSEASFVQGVTSSITLAQSGSTAQSGCYWDFTGATLSQKIPAETPVGNYVLSLTVTIAAS